MIFHGLNTAFLERFPEINEIIKSTLFEETLKFVAEEQSDYDVLAAAIHDTLFKRTLGAGYIDVIDFYTFQIAFLTSTMLAVTIVPKED